MARVRCWHVAGAQPRRLDLDGPVTLTFTFSLTFAFTHAFTLTLTPTLTLKGLTLTLKFVALKPTLTITTSARRKSWPRRLSEADAGAV